MIGELTYSSRWWAWWSNPAIRFHDEHRIQLARTQEQLSQIDYFDLLQLRSSLNLPDLPDDLLASRPELRSLAIENGEVLEKHLVRFALFSMDSSILHARPQDWETSFGVYSADLIREIVVLKHEFPSQLLQWQESMARHITHSLKKKLLLNDRIRLGLAVYLRSYFPRFYSRWQLTQGIEIVNWADSLETISPELWEVVDEWSNASFNAFHSEVFAPFDTVEFDFPADDEDFQFTSLDESTLTQEHDA